MISFITGKPGDGKSLYATRQILEDLIKTEVFVVTNIPLVLGRVQEYVSAKRPADAPPFLIDERVKVLPDAEIYEFYRHRSGGLVLNWSPDKEAGDDGTKRLARPEFVAKMKTEFTRIKASPDYQRPVHFYIDEAHNFFSSREWATNGRGLLYYASQHRHLWDNIFLITQVMENVEKQLRSLVSETHQVRNQLRRRIGPVRMRPVFKVNSYYGVPAGNIKPFDVRTFELDPARVAACYQTVGALGVHSTPENQKNKAPLPWWLLPVGGVLGVLVIGGLIVALPYLGGKAGTAVVGGALGGAAKAGGPVSIPGVSIPAGAGATRSAGGPASAGSVVRLADSPALPHPTGSAWAGRMLIVQMSDGTRRFVDRDNPSASDDVTQVTPSRVLFGSRPDYIRPAIRADQQPVQASPGR